MSVGGTGNSAPPGRTATVKRHASEFRNLEMYVVEWDDGSGWPDPEGGIGWHIERTELILLSEIEPFEVDE